MARKAKAPAVLGTWQCALCEATDAGTMVTRSKRRKALCTDCDADLLARGYDWCPSGAHKARQTDMATSGARCRACEAARTRRDRRDYSKAWRERNRERHLAYGAEYRQRNRDALRARRRAYYWRDPATARAYSRQMYAKHIDKKRVWRKAIYWRDPLGARRASRLYAIRQKLRILRGEA
jgi:hypothetical protein